ncbi:hypothetical protein BKA63DRAFT_559969 [Paraphoma chrysanthemicola]|nr:hypothetical protein BKA63DRAFT_559969 [Paraphoma chrysanthemicola]
MAVVKKRGPARKRGPISLGRKFIQVKVSNSERLFATHEDLICANSKLFKRRLQGDRKVVEGECTICHEDLDPKKDDITFCTSCGQNVHEKCMEQWNQARAGTTTCPLCRRIWREDREDLIVLDEPLDSDAVQLYIDWLYTGCLQYQESSIESDEDFNLMLLKAWTVSVILKDTKFRYALIAEYVHAVVNESHPGFWLASVKYAFEENSSPSMRSFVADAFLANMEPDWFHNESHEFPTSFTHYLCRSILQSLKDKVKDGELLQAHTNGEYELEENDDGSEADNGEAGNEDGEDEDEDTGSEV